MASLLDCKRKAHALGTILTATHKTVATAESCTGGMVGACFTEISGSSLWYVGGIIAYANSVKIKYCGVLEDILNTYGAVSTETVSIMASHTSLSFNASYAIALSGIAGPGGGSADKPVGLVYWAICKEGLVYTYHTIFKGNRHSIRMQAVEGCLDSLYDLIK